VEGSVLPPARTSESRTRGRSAYLSRNGTGGGPPCSGPSGGDGGPVGIPAPPSTQPSAGRVGVLGVYITGLRRPCPTRPPTRVTVDHGVRGVRDLGTTARTASIASEARPDSLPYRAVDVRRERQGVTGANTARTSPPRRAGFARPAGPVLAGPGSPVDPSPGVPGANAARGRPADPQRPRGHPREKRPRHIPSFALSPKVLSPRLRVPPGRSPWRVATPARGAAGGAQQR
jgi:hypothetical protein